jgi:hypothetical protein
MSAALVHEDEVSGYRTPGHQEPPGGPQEPVPLARLHASSADVGHALRLAAHRRVADRDSGEPLKAPAPVGGRGEGASFEVRREEPPGLLVELRLGPGLFLGAGDLPPRAIPTT